MASTTKKGGSFEIAVFKKVEQLVSKGEFAVNPSTAKVFRQKKYPSKDSRSGIIFDVTVESFLSKNSATYSVLYVIECKNYNRTVEVNVVRELSSKLDEVGCDNTKGLILTTKGFQKGAIDAAKSRGIALGLLSNDGDDIKWLLPRINKFSSLPSSTTLSIHASGEQCEHYFLDGSKKFNTLHELFVYWKISSNVLMRQNHIDIPKITAKHIDGLVEVFKDYFYIDGVLNEELMLSRLYEQHGVTLSFGDLGEIDSHDILGQLSLTDKKIIISNTIKEHPTRRRFTLAHEVGHFFLHSEYLTKHISDIYDIENTVDGCISGKEAIPLERQANAFASHLLLPESHLKDDFATYSIDSGITRKGKLYLDHQPCNKRLVFGFLNACKLKYTVSSEAVKYRLINLGLLEESGSPSALKCFLPSHF